MEKKALALRDGADEEEAVAGELGLIELATAPGASPDELAWELQRRFLVRELVALAPVAALLLGLVPEGAVGTVVAVYTLLGWPVVLLFGTWQPMRSSRGWSLRPVADLCFLGGAGLLGVIGGMLAGGLTGWTGFRVLRGVLGLGNGPADLLAIALGFGVGVFACVRTMATILVERELEALPDAAVPDVDALAEAGARLEPFSQVRSVARASFRAAGLGALALVPLGLAAALGLLEGSRGLPPALGAWALIMALLAGQYLVRSLFYLGLTSEGLAQLARRRGELAAPEQARGAVASRRAWQGLRCPGGLARAIGLGGLVAALSSAGWLGPLAGAVALLGVLALVPLIPVGDGMETSAPPARRALAGALGAIPAAAMMVGCVALLRTNGPVAPLLGPLIFPLMLVILERATWLWARASRRLLHGEAADPAGSPVAGVRAGAEVAERALLLGAALGFPAMAAAYFLPWNLRELGAVAYRMAMIVGPVVSVVAAMRMHLAIAEAGAVPRLAGPPPPGEVEAT